MVKKFNLDEIFENSSETTKLIILDIDSTLVTTYQRNQAILNLFCKEMREDYPEESQRLSGAQCQLGDYGYFTALERLSVPPQDPVFMAELQNFWRKHFFSNKFLHEDVPAPGAVDFVNRISNEKIPFVYLTGRYKERMWEGTLSSLKHRGFPINEEILILKEDLSLSDGLYKSMAIERLKDKYKDHQLWIIDNEPAILNQTLKDHPDVQLVWFESCHSGREEPPQSVRTIQDFKYL
ncbi:MAG: HAD family hydrolase [Bdellovibrionales bacterium]|nr:HAD family hydrolase [Bdellovibrionales bacterium]NQZ18681.1 HAD family hydrolase [Bdellovibrionales bacterium]